MRHARFQIWVGEDENLYINFKDLISYSKEAFLSSPGTESVEWNWFGVEAPLRLLGQKADFVRI